MCIWLNDCQNLHNKTAENIQFCKDEKLYSNIVVKIDVRHILASNRFELTLIVENSDVILYRCRVVKSAFPHWWSAKKKKKERFRIKC